MFSTRPRAMAEPMEAARRQTEANTVCVSRTYRTTVQAAFDAWTRPAILERWFGPPGYSASILTHDLKIGGSWRFLMRGQDGTALEHFGEFVAIDPPTKLAFTWASEEPFDGWRDTKGEPTLVTVTFDQDGEEVTVTVTHEGLVLEEARRGLTFGWGRGLDCLDEVLI